MTHEITYDPITKIIRIKVTGNILLDEIKQIYIEAIQNAKEEEAFLFLSDYRQAQISLSAVEIYELPRTFVDIAKSAGYNPYHLKRAILPSGKPEDFRFFETVSINSGQSFAKLFQEVDEAIGWLTEK